MRPFDGWPLADLALDHLQILFLLFRITSYYLLLFGWLLAGPLRAWLRDDAGRAPPSFALSGNSRSRLGAAWG